MLKAPFWPATSRSKYRRFMPPPGIHTHRRGAGKTLWGTKRSAVIRLQPAGATALTSTVTLDRRTASISASDRVRRTGSEFTCATLNDAPLSGLLAASISPSTTCHCSALLPALEHSCHVSLLGLVGQVPDTFGISGENQCALARWDRVELLPYHLPRVRPGGDRMWIVRRPHDVLD